MIKNLTITLLCLSACSSEMDDRFSGSGSKYGAAAENDGVADSQDASYYDANGEPTDGRDGNTLIQKAELPLAADKMVDYLLVLDNSISMEQAIKKARAGLLNVLSSKSFNSNSRVGVINTMPGAPSTNFETVHPAIINTYIEGGRMKWEPGFLSLMNKEAVDKAVANNPLFPKAKYPLTLCDQGFFEPYQRQANGHYCLEAAMQISLLGLGVEDGLLSLTHFMQKRGNQPSFRPGSELHVVYISDTHAPGINKTAQSAGLFGNRPTSATIIGSIRKHNDVADIFVHAIAPEAFENNCTEGTASWPLGKTYFEFVKFTNGLQHDICKEEGYSDFFSAMVKKANQERYMIRLDKKAAKIVDIQVNGEKPLRYKLLDQRSVEFFIEPSDRATVSVSVSYLPQL